jgi:DNA primase
VPAERIDTYMNEHVRPSTLTANNDSWTYDEGLVVCWDIEALVAVVQQGVVEFSEGF